jgi:hypothetical protein
MRGTAVIVVHMVRSTVAYVWFAALCSSFFAERRGLLVDSALLPAATQKMLAKELQVQTKQLL